MGKPVCTVGDTFSGTIIAPNLQVKGNPPTVFSISGVYDVPNQASTKANKKLVIVEGGKGTYICPTCGTPHTVTVTGVSGLVTSEGKGEHRLGDDVVCDVHTTVSILATSGQSNVKDN